MIVCTAWDLVGGNYTDLIDNTHEIIVGNGRTVYHSAEVTRGYTGVRLERLNNTTEGVYIVRRYLKPDDIVVLVPIRK